MMWFYQRGNQHLFYEVRLRDDGPGYELGLASPEGTLLTERFITEEALTRRFAELQACLAPGRAGDRSTAVRRSHPSSAAARVAIAPARWSVSAPPSKKNCATTSRNCPIDSL